MLCTLVDLYKPVQESLGLITERFNWILLEVSTGNFQGLLDPVHYGVSLEQNKKSTLFKKF